MCAQRWAKINFSQVPSLCLDRHKRAFLNEGRGRNRDEEDRIACRERLLAVIVVRKPLGLARVVCMADVIGSMSGIPMHVAIALGILTSAVSHPAFRDKVLTFDSRPQWHDLSAKTSLVGKVQSLARAPWGGSTNFAEALRLIVELVQRERLEQHDIPDLLVVSDMQFDQARGAHGYGGFGGFGGYGYGHAQPPSPWDTAHEQIVRLFHDVGMHVHGQPLSPPNIIFWNVRADTLGYPAAADQKGVMLLSGYSPALMKFIMSGELEEERIVLDEEGNAVKVRTQVDPRETLRRVLHESGLEPVRAVLDERPPESFL
jgi:hypothetical protein